MLVSGQTARVESSKSVKVSDLSPQSSHAKRLLDQSEALSALGTLSEILEISDDFLWLLT